MAELCLMASHGYPPGLVLHPDHCLSRVPKGVQPLLPRSGSLIVRPHQDEDSWKTMGGLSESSSFVSIGSPIKKPVLVNVQDAHPGSTLFSFGISDQCTKQQEVLKFLGSERGEIDLSILTDLMGIKAIDMPQPLSQLSLTEFYPNKHLLELIGNLRSNSEITINSNEIRNALSVIAEFYLSKNAMKVRKQPLLVPHFDRLDCDEASGSVRGSALKRETVVVAPLKSPTKVKMKPSPRKKSNRKPGKERDMYRKNYFQACESLLSIIVDSKRNKRNTILSLKKSGPELPHLLTQFSATVAGTGLAVLFSVACKLASGRVPFCGSKLLTTGFGLGLVWVSWAVNRLRDNVVSMSKNCGKIKVSEEEMMKKLDSSVKEIYFRVATVMAVALLRVA